MELSNRRKYNYHALHKQHASYNILKYTKYNEWCNYDAWYIV